MKIGMLVPDNRDEFRRYADPEPSFGTAPTALLEGLAQIPECEVHIVSCTQQKLRAPAQIAGNIFFHSLLVPKWGWLRGGYIGCMRAVRKKLREINPDIVHGQGTERYCALSAVRSGFPNVLTIHGNMRLIARINRARPFSFEWLAARLESFTLPRSDGIVCITSYTQRAVASLARATWIVPNAVAGSFFDIELRPAAPREIVCIGNITTRKNQVRLIEALQPLAVREKFELIFYGGAVREDPYVREFFQRIEKSPWCRFAGFADRAGLRAALARASMLVLPSLEDNCPMSVLEAMAAGVPVAAARVGGVPDLITDKVDGVLFDPTEIESIRGAVSAILLHGDNSAKLAVAGKEKAQACFHPKRIASRHIEIYQEVLLRACLKTTRRAAARDFGRGQGGGSEHPRSGL
jgi:glycosyltransferase involved in cell wall biosynthesis